jgi:hypothetical protein
MLEIARLFPEAFWAGLDAVLTQYKFVGEGKIAERPFPSNPFPRPPQPQGEITEWHAWNAGWNEGLSESRP